MEIKGSCIKSVEFVKSVFSTEDLPDELGPELAFAGRSNVGKSSVLNAIFNRRNLVKVSSRPGFTQSLNFFLVNDSSYFVDLPGYGFAKAPKKVIKKWQNLVEGYIRGRNALRGVVCIFDIRRGIDELDIALVSFLKGINVLPIVVFNKIDKLSNNQVNQSLERARILLPGLEKGPYCLSAKTKKGVQAFLERAICPFLENGF